MSRPLSRPHSRPLAVALAALLGAAACGDAFSARVESARRRALGDDAGASDCCVELRGGADGDGGRDDDSDGGDGGDADSPDHPRDGMPPGTSSGANRYELCLHPQFAQQGEHLRGVEAVPCEGAAPPPWDCASAWLPTGAYSLGEALYLGGHFDVKASCALSFDLVVDGLAEPGERVLEFRVVPSAPAGGVRPAAVTLWGYFHVLRFQGRRAP